MSYSNTAINPRFISVLTGKDVTDKPTVSMLPGTYAQIVSKNKNKITNKYRDNKHALICRYCGRKGIYDLGMVMLSPEKWKLYGEFTVDGPQGADIAYYIQTTGYFRCKHCNGAGNWSSGTSLFLFAVLGGLLKDKDRDNVFSFGKYALYDGFEPQWASEGEDHLLDKLHLEGEDAFIWNRLGNLYKSGGSPELAAAAYEKSLELDPLQMESHYSIAELLMEIGEWELSSFHFRRMLLSARSYDRMAAEKTRELLAAGLTNAMLMHVESDRRIPFLPEKDEIEEVAALTGTDGREGNSAMLQLVELELLPGNPESYYPLAEMYMGEQAKNIPTNKRTFESLNNSGVYSNASYRKIESAQKKVRIKGQLKKKRKKRK
jgi:hypothetical protein